MATPRLKITRAQVLAFRRHSGGLDKRLPAGPDSLRAAAWAGLQDSMPRAALLSMHARVEGIEPGSWEDPSLVQLWGPRFSAYVVAERDRAVFTLGRLPDDPGARREAEQLADRLEAFLEGRRMTCGEAARGVGKRHPNALRYAAPTGRVVMRWDGARRPTIWTVPLPALDPGDARLELAASVPPRVRTGDGGGLRRVGRDPAGALSGHIRRVGGIADAGPHARRRRMDLDRGRGGVPHFCRRSSGACAAPPQR